MLEGRCTFDQLGFEMQVHANDTLETKTANASFMVPPKLTVVVMLEGDLDATLDGQPLPMTAQRGPTGYLWFNRQPAQLERWIRAGQRVRKVTISVPLQQPQEGSVNSALHLLAALPTEMQHMAFTEWQLTAQAIRRAEEILTTDAAASPLARLELSIAALGIVQTALSHCKDCGKLAQLPMLSTRDAGRARQARDFILQHIDEMPSVDDVARRNGMSVSTLQRVFKRCFGMTVNEFVRTRRLEIARLSMIEDGVTVGEAAYQAGYSSAANFSTAFQRTFGYPPSACLDH
jgi:AraC-like DNA-binding protein